MTANIRFGILLGLFVLLSGCTLGMNPPATTVPGQLETEVARQVSQQLTQVALSQPSPTPLPTQSAPTLEPPSPTPQPTETVVQPTVEVPSPTPTALPPTLTATLPVPTATLKPLPTATSLPFACQVTNQNPANGKNFKPGADFDVVWTVKNVGTTFWNNDEADYRYQSGDKFHQIEVYDISKRVNPGESVDLLADMKAPDKEGKYKTVWVLRQGSNVLCTLSLEINVKK